MKTTRLSILSLLVALTSVACVEADSADDSETRESLQAFTLDEQASVVTTTRVDFASLDIFSQDGVGWTPWERLIDSRHAMVDTCHASNGAKAVPALRGATPEPIRELADGLVTTYWWTCVVVELDTRVAQLSRDDLIFVDPHALPCSLEDATCVRPQAVPRSYEDLDLR